MIKIICDKCKEEIKNPRFQSEINVREVKDTIVGKEFRPQLVEKRLHLCQDCFADKLKDLTN